MQVPSTDSPQEHLTRSSRRGTRYHSSQVFERAKAILANLEAQALDVRGSPALAPPRADTKQEGGARPLQLDLFRDDNGKLLKKLKKLKVEEMSPLEAINYLAKLRDRIV